MLVSGEFCRKRSRCFDRFYSGRIDFICPVVRLLSLRGRSRKEFSSSIRDHSRGLSAKDASSRLWIFVCLWHVDRRCFHWLESIRQCSLADDLFDFLRLSRLSGRALDHRLSRRSFSSESLQVGDSLSTVVLSDVKCFF